MLTAEDLSLLPSPADVEQYQTLGYWISPPIFSTDEIEDALFGCECFYAGERDYHLHEQLSVFGGWRPEHGDVLRINDYVSLQKRELARLVQKPLLGAIAARLCGSSVIRLWHDQLIYKPPERQAGTTAIGWHTDKAYWHTCTSDRMLTAWIPLTDCDAALGTLMVVAGSHKWAGDLRGFHLTALEASEAGLTSPDGSLQKVPLTLRAGQVSFHHCHTVHGSGANVAARPRISVSVHLQDGENRYRKAMAPDGEAGWHRNDMLCRRTGGEPDYADRDICPELWRAENA